MILDSDRAHLNSTPSIYSSGKIVLHKAPEGTYNKEISKAITTSQTQLLALDTAYIITFLFFRLRAIADNLEGWWEADPEQPP